MIDHFGINCADLEASGRFYDTVLATLGHRRLMDVGEAVGYGTDTGGSVRLPAACCGIVGLKTTFGRISTRGVWPLSLSLDTVGPLARDVAGIVEGMALLEPGFSVAGVAPGTVKSRLSRARSALAATLTPLEVDDV